MNTTLKVLRYELRDVLRGRWVIAYGLLFLVLTEALLRFGGSGERALLSLMNLVLLVIPLVSLVFGTIYLYGARDFNELLLTQPVHRRQLFGGLYLGLAVPLSLAFAAGVAMPFVFRSAAGDAGIANTAMLGPLLAVGVALTLAFTAIAFWVAVRIDDRARGLGTAVLLWLGLAIIYDGLVLLVATTLSAYPLERPMIALMLVNPLDLGRVLLLMTFDAAALMGYTGAVFQRFFGSPTGAVLAAGALAAWVAGPLALGMRRFQRKDF